MSLGAPWYPEGLRFGCTACGECCRREGVVFVRRREARRIAEHLGGPMATPRDFVPLLWTPTPDGGFQIDVPAGSACPLLVDGRCSVHAIKPQQCATYPFWPEIVTSEGAWAAEATFCEGIGRGERVYSVDEVWEILLERAKTEDGGGEEA